MKYKDLSFTACLASIALMSQSAHGEEATTATLSKTPGYMVGSFRIRPSVSLSETYNDNILYSQSGELDDWITVITPTLKANSNWSKHSLSVEAGLTAGRYNEYDAENYTDYWVNLKGSYDIDETSELFGGFGLTFDHEGRDSPDYDQQPTTYYSRNAHAGYKKIIGDTTLRVAGTYEELQFENVISATGINDYSYRDRELIGLGVRASHKLNTRSQVYIQGLLDWRDYDQNTDRNGYQRDSDGYRVSLGLKNDYGKGNRAEAYIGVISQDYDDNRFDSVDEIDFGGDVKWRAGENTVISGNLKRTLNETTVSASPGYLRTSAFARVDHRVSEKTVPYFRLGYTQNDYQQNVREDDNYFAEAAINYYLSSNVTLTGGVLYSERDSNIAGNDYENSSIFLTLSTQGYPLFEPMISEFKSHGEFEIGLLGISDDSLRFGRHTGLTENGYEWNSNFLMHSSDGRSNYASIEARDLGLESRSIRLDWGDQGRYDAFVYYDQLPSYDFIGQTIFDNAGSTTLTRPAGWVDGDSTGDFTQLPNALSDIRIGTMRKKIGLGSDFYNMRNNWVISLDYNTETKEGLEQIAGISGNSPGNGRSAILPAPVDYTTNTFNASMGYLGKKTQLNFAYNSSLFYNNLKSLTWESPFDATGTRSIDNSLSLAPDNQMHQLSVSGGHTISGATRFTGMASVALMLQDDDFLPDNINTANSNALPRNNLDGEVLLYNTMLALSGRPLKGLNLKGSYRMSKRDNNTPVDSFTYAINDSDTGPGPSTTSSNSPYSYEKHTLKLDGGYRINTMARLTGDITHETYESDQSEVQETTEDSGELKLRLKATDNIQVSVSGNTSSRDGSNYNTVAGENTLLRKYNIADRERIGGGINVAYQPDEKLALSASLDIADDEYDNTAIGLTDATRTSLVLDASYQFNDALTTYAYAGREIYESGQAGSQNTTSDTADWWVDNEDTVDSLGAGMRWQSSSRLEIGADYTMSLANGDIDIRSNNALAPVQPFPDLESNLHSLKLYADYQWHKNTHVKFSYWYEKYDEDNWSVDGVSVDTIPEVLSMGEPNGSYDQHVIGISLITKF